MLLLLERKNKFWCVWCCRASLNIWPEVFCQKKGRPLTTFSFIPTLFWAHTQFQLIFCSFFFILGLGWVVVWCRHELVFLIDQSSHLCNPCSPSEEAKSKGKNWKVKNNFQKLKNYFSPRPATCRVDLVRLMPCSRGGGESSLRTCLLQIQMWTFYLKYYLDKRK